jgi:WhiB family redox-sensing transcriptional regulator
MERRGRDWLPTGCERVFPITTVSVTVIRTSSMPPALPSTAVWMRADLVTIPDYYVEPEYTQRKVSWSDLMPEWHEDAKCRSIENADDTFFGEIEDSDRTSLTITKIRAVKEYCRQCPVFTECLIHALTTPERHGIWAGTSKRTRLRILDLIDEGVVTITQVVEDYQEGREKRYESIRRSTQ